MSGSILPQTFDLTTSNPRRHFWSRPPTRLTIDGTGIRIEYGEVGTKELRWDDPECQFALLDYRAPMKSDPRFVWTPTLFEFRYRPPSVDRVYLPEEAFVALGTAALSMGLTMVPGRPGRGLLVGTKVCFYGRSQPE